METDHFRVNCQRNHQRSAEVVSDSPTKYPNGTLKNICFCILEREENVKSDIFNAYIALLRQTRPMLQESQESADR